MLAEVAVIISSNPSSFIMPPLLKVRRVMVKISIIKLPVRICEFLRTRVPIGMKKEAATPKSA